VRLGLTQDKQLPFGGQFGASTPNCLAYEAGAEALPLREEIWPGPAIKLALASRNWRNYVSGHGRAGL
jgi:hypothetical protein